MSAINFDYSEVLTTDHPVELLERAQPFIQLMTQYQCAMLEVETKLRVLDHEFAFRHNRNPIETIKTRLKTPMSIIGKLQRKGLPLSIQCMEENLSDIAGIRVICSFPDDIYTVAACLIEQDDISLL